MSKLHKFIENYINFLYTIFSKGVYMKVIRNLNGINLSKINSVISEDDVDGFSLSAEYEKGILVNHPFWRIEQGLWTILQPSSKIFLLRLYNNCKNLDEESIIRFIKSIMPLIKKYPNLILEHFSVEELRKVKESLANTSNPHQISIATRVKHYYSAREIKELGVDYEVHEHIHIPFIASRVNRGERVIYDSTDNYCRDIPNLLYETQCSDNLHIITQQPDLIKRMASNCPKK